MPHPWTQIPVEAQLTLSHPEAVHWRVKSSGFKQDNEGDGFGQSQSWFPGGREMRSLLEFTRALHHRLTIILMKWNNKIKCYLSFIYFICIYLTSCEALFLKYFYSIIFICYWYGCGLIMGKKMNRRLNPWIDKFFISFIDIRRRIELIQDFVMPTASTNIEISEDGNYVMASGTKKLNLNLQINSQCNQVINQT